MTKCLFSRRSRRVAVRGLLAVVLSSVAAGPAMAGNKFAIAKPAAVVSTSPASTATAADTTSTSPVSSTRG